MPFLLRELRAWPRARAEGLLAIGEGATRAGAPATRFAVQALLRAHEAWEGLGDVAGRRAAAEALGRIDGGPDVAAWAAYALARAEELARPPASPFDVALLRGLPAALRKALAPEIVLHDPYKAGQRIAVEGVPGEELLLLRTGRVRILQRRDGVEFFLRYRLPGESVMEMAWLSERRRTATVVADEETCSWLLRFDAIDRLVRRFPVLRRRLEEVYAERRLETRLAQSAPFASLDVTARFALERIARTLRTGRMEAGERLVEAGRPIEELVLVLDGAVDLKPLAPAPVTTLHTTGEEPLLFGRERLLATSVTSTVSVTAASDGWVAVLPATAVRAVLDRAPPDEVERSLLLP